MVSRLFSLLCWQLAGGLAGWWLGDPPVGLVGGAMVWLAVDSMRGARVLKWLRWYAKNMVSTVPFSFNTLAMLRMCCKVISVTRL